MMKLKHNLLGRTFGFLEVTRRDETRRPRVAWITKCHCGNEHSALSHNLMSGSTVHCGCKRLKRGKNESRYSKYLGQKINRLSIQSYVVENGKQFLQGVCDCGRYFKCRYSNVLSGKQKSCGCLRLEMKEKPKKTLAPGYSVWQRISRRVDTCEEWRNFENFTNDMGERPTPQHRLVQIRSTVNFSKENCIWVKLQDQKLYREPKRFIDIEGTLHTAREAASKLGVTHQAIYQRLNKGWKNIRNESHPKFRGYKKRVTWGGRSVTIKEYAAINNISYSNLVRKRALYALSVKRP